MVIEVLRRFVRSLSGIKLRMSVSGVPRARNTQFVLHASL
jgi:hypothetical protein